MIYEPREDSFLLLKQIKNYAHGKVLDMGTGSGILAEEAKKYSETVLAVDIDLFAVEHVKRQGINAIQSDLFQNVEGKFDLIMFNPPYLPADVREDQESATVTTGGSKGWEIVERFLQDAKDYLSNEGKILLVFSSLTDKTKMDSILTEEKFKFKQIDSLKLAFEELFLYLALIE